DFSLSRPGRNFLASVLRSELRIFLHEKHTCFVSDLLRRVALSAADSCVFSLAAFCGRDLPTFLSDNLRCYKIQFVSRLARLSELRSPARRQSSTRPCVASERNSRGCRCRELVSRGLCVPAIRQSPSR